MPLSYDATWTATTASIKFMGEEIGELQDFTLDENFNTQRIQGIGHPADLRHIPGFYQATLTSRRAFIKASKMFTLMTTADAAKVAQYAGGTFDPTTRIVSGLDTVGLTQALAETALTRNILGITLNFDIEVKAKFVENGVVSEQTIYVLNECSVSSRSSSVTTGNVIIFENLTIFPKYKSIPGGLGAGDIIGGASL